MEDIVFQNIISYEIWHIIFDMIPYQTQNIELVCKLFWKISRNRTILRSRIWLTPKVLCRYTKLKIFDGIVYDIDNRLENLELKEITFCRYIPVNLDLKLRPLSLEINIAIKLMKKTYRKITYLDRITSKDKLEPSVVICNNDDHIVVLLHIGSKSDVLQLNRALQCISNGWKDWKITLIIYPHTSGNMTDLLNSPNTSDANVVSNIMAHLNYKTFNNIDFCTENSEIFNRMYMMKTLRPYLDLLFDQKDLVPSQN